MKSLIIFFLAVTLAAAIEEILENPNRIIDGMPAALGQFPYQVGLNIDGKCSGTLISSEWVLTTAYCVDKRSSAEVLLGGINWKKPDISFTVNSSNFIMHENYNSKENNIALIKIPPVKFTNSIRKIELPKNNQRHPQYNGKKVVVSGWGYVSVKNLVDDNLRYSEMKVISNKACSNIHYELVNANVICANPFNGGSVCGDSGAPMVLKDKNILIGVTSFQPSVCKLSEPSGFTRVTSYLDWIKKHTGIEY